MVLSTNMSLYYNTTLVLFL